jgi:hypothetical protein
MRCSSVSPQPNIMVAVVRMPSACAVRCTSIHSGVALQPADAVAHAIVQNLRAAAGDGIETRIAQAGDGVAQAQAADFGDVGDLRRGEAVQVM